MGRDPALNGPPRFDLLVPPHEGEEVHGSQGRNPVLKLVETFHALGGRKLYLVETPGRWRLVGRRTDGLLAEVTGYTLYHGPLDGH